MRGLVVAVAAASVAAFVLGVTPSAKSAFPGLNGEIAFSIVMPNSREGVEGDARHLRVDLCRIDWQTREREPLVEPNEQSVAAYVDAAWSATGDRLLLVLAGPTDTNINLLDKQAGVARTLLGRARSPAWHPSGEQFAFVVLGGGISVSNLLGESRVVREGQAEAPAWSPDGMRIAFIDRGQLALMNGDGTQVTRLTADPRLHYSPNWSPDGKHLVFVSQTSRASAPVIERIDADGSNRTALTPIRASLNLGDAGFADPTWSPDGTKIAFVQKQAGEDATDIYVMNPDGSGTRNLTRTPFTEFGIDWRTRGTALRRSTSTCGVSGTRGTDRLSGRATHDVIYALDGADSINAGGGDDIVLAGAGRDRVRLGSGHDLGLGEAGTDVLEGDAGRDELDGGPGNDHLGGGDGDDLLGLAQAEPAQGERGADTMLGGNGADVLFGGPGNDRLTGGRGSDRIVAGDGNDTLQLRDGATDVASCGRGRDVVYADRRDRVSRDCERVLRG